MPTLAELPKAPAASLAAAPTVVPPPVKAGQTRLGHLDVDLALPSGVGILERAGSVGLSWSGCSVSITPTLRPEHSSLRGAPRVVRRVGTLELACVARPWAANAADPWTPPDPKCLAVCDHMAPVPRSTAEERYPTEPPVIEIELAGGFAGVHEGTLVWSDGTVQYSGSRCKTWRGRRATLPPARVAALLSAAERGGFFDYHRNDLRRCTDTFYGTIALRRGGARHSLEFDDCDRSGVSTFVYELMQAIGRNPCQAR